MKYSNTGHQGFTLIELSIVLVIIGLITGSIFIGQSLVRQSQLNSAVSDFQKYTQAIIAFQQKYGALPGDFATAQPYWGTGTTCPSTYASPLSGTATCNGDGNGQIGMAAAWTAAPAEMFLVWQHLVNAGFITGYYNGSPGNAGTKDHVINVNAPGSRVEGAGFGIGYIGSMNSDTYWFDGTWGHQIDLGSYYSNNWPATGILTANEAYSIDSKIDDGLPATGIISTEKPAGTTNCATTSVSSTAAYKLTQSGYVCNILYTTGFEF